MAFPPVKVALSLLDPDFQDGFTPEIEQRKESIFINVGGMRYRTKVAIFALLPKTRLVSLTLFH